MDQRKGAQTHKHGIKLGGVSDRLKKQASVSRIGKRNDITKRFRGSTSSRGGGTVTESALQAAVQAIQVGTVLKMKFTLILRNDQLNSYLNLSSLE